MNPANSEIIKILSSFCSAIWALGYWSAPLLVIRWPQHFQTSKKETHWWCSGEHSETGRILGHAEFLIFPFNSVRRSNTNLFLLNWIDAKQKLWGMFAASFLTRKGEIHHNLFNKHVRSVYDVTSKHCSKDITLNETEKTPVHVEHTFWLKETDN